MNTTELSRRSLLVTTTANATLLPFASEHAFSQGSSSARWFDLVKEQHANIIAQLSVITDLLPLPPARVGELIPQLKALSYLLTAHSVAEENVL